MVSFNSAVALASSSREPQEPTRSRQRRDWVRGEVRCLMCGRLIGRLLGARNHGHSGDRSSDNVISFFAYRSAGVSEPVVACTPLTRFHCTDCGGAGALDDIELFSTHDEVPLTPEEIGPVRRGPGRPPHMMNRIAPGPQALDLALAKLADSA